jgi:hypothetical protein
MRVYGGGGEDKATIPSTHTHTHTHTQTIPKHDQNYRTLALVRGVGTYCLPMLCE